VAKLTAQFQIISRAPCGLRLTFLEIPMTNWTQGWEQATMGSMSASDAAPLPRPGEAFFDARGSSRSMRLSWYADTSMSVFSIWQGGTCTGTFRLPQEELPRLIDALQRGMHHVSRASCPVLRPTRGSPRFPVTEAAASLISVAL
jgi:hypothetical protein